MGLLRIDETRCKRDGICARECPAGIIRLSDGGKGYPELVTDGESMCIVCGHCVAVCPHGAVSHEHVGIEDSPELKKDLEISEGQAVQFLRSRRSIRLYEERPVEREKIRRLIEVARYAPTGANMQPVEWLVIDEKRKVRELAIGTMEWFRRLMKDDLAAAADPHLRRLVDRWDEGYDSVLRGAPTVVIASAPEEAMSGLVDLTLALSYLDLYAPTIGLGTCWAGLLHGALLFSVKLREAAGLPEHHTHHYSMMVGYPKVEYYRVPERREPKITFV
jgi:nitroreductase/NAD-dependent dihydropyrimidine dehydrogenase PreA subunit